MVRTGCVALLLGGLLACSSADGGSEFGDESAIDTPDKDKASKVDVVDDGAGTKPTGLGATCASESAQAKRGALDVVFVIDDSGSMTEEMAQVRKNVNNFATAFAKSGLDYHVVMLTIRGTQGNSICVPAPLAGPGCADNLPTFRHVSVNVGSTNSFDVILNSYPQWSASLRVDATKIFVEVTDDNAARITASDFQNRLSALAVDQFGTPDKPHYIFNSIVGWQEGTPILDATKCASAVNIGSAYQELSKKTGGIVDSVCKADYSGVLNNLAKNISDRLACDFRLPVATGATDPNKVLVNYTPASGTTTELVRVTDASKCATFANGWYYDDNSKPTIIKLCTGTCDTVRATTDPKIGIQLGCAVPEPK